MKKHLSIFLLSSSILLSNTLSNDIGSCSKLKDSLKRLSCYDNVAINHKLSIQTTSIPASASSNWSVNVTSDPMTDNKVVTFLNTSSVKTARYKSPITLIARCTSGIAPDMFISWHDYLGLKVYVTSRFDKEEVKSLEWSISTDKTASFFPYELYDDIPILERFIQHNHFVARTVPYNKSPLTVDFNLAGFAKVVEPYMDICKIAGAKEKRARLQKEKEEKNRKYLERKRKCEELGKNYIEIPPRYTCTSSSIKGIGNKTLCETIIGGRWDYSNGKWNCF